MWHGHLGELIWVQASSVEAGWLGCGRDGSLCSGGIPAGAVLPVRAWMNQGSQQQATPANLKQKRNLFKDIIFSQTYFFLIEGKLLHNTVLASAVYQHELATGAHVTSLSSTSLPPSTPSHSSRLLQSPAVSSLSHAANSHWLSTLHMVVNMFP